MKGLPYSRMQASIGVMHGIPRNQWHTINPSKVKAYFKWFYAPEQRVLRALDYIQRGQMLRKQREYIECRELS